MITYLIILVVAFAAGFVSGVINANSKKVQKAQDILDAIKK